MLSLGVTSCTRGLDTRLRALGMPGVRLVSELGELAAGEPGHLTLLAPARTLLRVLVGVVGLARADHDLPVGPAEGALTLVRRS